MKEVSCSNLTPDLSRERKQVELFPHQSSGRSGDREARSPPPTPAPGAPVPASPDQGLTTSAQHSNLFIVVPGKPQALGGGGGGVSAPVRLCSPCAHHVIYSVPATGSIGLALIIHSLSGPNFAPFFFRNLGRERGSGAGVRG